MYENSLSLSFNYILKLFKLLYFMFATCIKCMFCIVNDTIGNNREEDSIFHWKDTMHFNIYKRKLKCCMMFYSCHNLSNKCRIRVRSQTIFQKESSFTNGISFPFLVPIYQFASKVGHKSFVYFGASMAAAADIRTAYLACFC